MVDKYTKDVNCCSANADARDLRYNGRCLDSIRVMSGDTLDAALMSIGSVVEDMKFDIKNISFTGNNVGGNIGIYKGLNDRGIHEFKTLEVGRGINVKNTENSIQLYISDEYIRGLILDIINGL